ncbi:hypothetical protein PVA44_06220 [Entomospira nematocerorum]|uniref:Uncharacterized protein n=1 Tax=Entomospira nematocerorum TaxID=2719987 RepID=A0A968KTN7_9SPIO|nr:hypothetical protein [Entomospira nematocera]NIZ46384.1 hypothetical protein [Entomospira nematocera]WDI33812.1 hypothetical protein PVA44_06220 [Entomospira nematocera]
MNLLTYYPSKLPHIATIIQWLEPFSSFIPLQLKKRTLFHTPLNQDPLPIPTDTYTHYALIYWRAKHKSPETHILQWWSELNKSVSQFPLILIEITNDPNPPMVAPSIFLEYQDKPLFFAISIKDIEEDPSIRVAFMHFIEQLTLSNAPDYESIE